MNVQSHLSVRGWQDESSADVRSFHTEKHATRRKKIISRAGKQGGNFVFTRDLELKVTCCIFLTILPDKIISIPITTLQWSHFAIPTYLVLLFWRGPSLLIQPLKLGADCEEGEGEEESRRLYLLFLPPSPFPSERVRNVVVSPITVTCGEVSASMEIYAPTCHIKI